ncbi:hypothetical protein CRG98_046961 [Punica granatum]|uniref:Squalene monooxygenase n=1 Tax=Punica granatum TaxID=22663 RepID=A0A2I0HLW3_PUNGR|nr:hypothetical protein CRG98_046961 [Punica granatum]
MAIEVLSKLLDKDAAEGKLAFHPKCSRTRLTHLAFVDDLLLFLKGELTSVKAVLDVFTVFYKMSGLRLSPSETELYCVALGTEDVRAMLQLNGFRAGSLPVRYLGVPLIPGRLSDKDFVVSSEAFIPGASHVVGRLWAPFVDRDDGRRVHVLERDLAEPDRIVGELLQPGGYLKLQELDLADCVSTIDAQRVLGYVMYKDRKHIQLPCLLEKFHRNVAGRSLHNGRFIQRIREKVAALPNVKLEQGTVRSLIKDKGIVLGVQYKTKDGQEPKVYAPLTIVCDGCFSNLRRSLCKPKVDIPSHFVGLTLENCSLPFPNHGHVILADPSPILSYPISSNEVRCLVDIPGQKLPSAANGEMSHYLKSVVASEISRAALHSPQCEQHSLLLLHLKPPFQWLNHHKAGLVALRNDALLHLQPGASTINTLAGALYKVLCSSPDPVKKELRDACFNYVMCSSGPASTSRA